MREKPFVKIHSLEEDSLIPLVVGNSNEINIGNNTGDHPIIFDDTESLFKNNDCNGKKINKCFYNSSESFGMSCSPLTSDLICVGNSFPSMSTVMIIVLF